MNRVSGIALIVAGCAILWMVRRSALARHPMAVGVARRGLGAQQPGSDLQKAPMRAAPNLSAVAKGMAELGGQPISPGGGSRGHMARARRRDATG